VAERSTDPILRKRLSGEAAAPYLGIARTQLGILKNLMSFQDLKQLSRTVELSDGTRIFVSSIFGQDTIRIDAPEIAPRGAGEEAAVISAINRVADYVGVMMPNPVPYRGVYARDGVDSVPGTVFMQFTASDGEMLGEERNTTYSPHTFAWDGGNSMWMFTRFSPIVFDHKIAISTPEDCIYTYPDPTLDPLMTAADYPGTDGLGDQWASEWNASVASLRSRRRVWYKKNSDEFIAALKGGFQSNVAGVTHTELQTDSIPASWDYQIKSQYGKNYGSFALADGSHAGRHTKMPIVMSATYTDTVLSDTSANFTQVGVKLMQRSVTFQYTDVNGVNRTATVNGTLTQNVVQYVLATGATTLLHDLEYSNWYSSTDLADMSFVYHQFLEDRSGYGVGLLWSGVTSAGYNKTSGYGMPPGNPFTYLGSTPTIPAYYDTLVGTAAPLYLQYHNTVLPQYVADTAQSSTVMNNSGMYHVKQIELCLFGPAPNDPTTHLPTAIGIFPDPTDADGATNIAYYGEASFQFDWAQGKLTLLGWSPRKDTNGNDAPTIVPMPAGYSYKNQAGTLYFNNGATNYTAAYNCAIGYVWDSPDQLWPDVAEYLRKKIAQMLSGGGDQMLYTVIKQALAL